MVKHKSNLADAVHGAARADKRPRENTAPDADTEAMKGVLLRLPPKLHRQLRQLSLDQNTTLPSARRGSAGTDTRETPTVKRGSNARRMQDRESDTGYDTLRRASDGALAGVSQTAVYDTY